MQIWKMFSQEMCEVLGPCTGVVAFSITKEYGKGLALALAKSASCDISYIGFGLFMVTNFRD